MSRTARRVVALLTSCLTVAGGSLVTAAGAGVSVTAPATARVTAPATAPAGDHERAVVAGQDGRIAFVRANQIYTMTRWGGDVTRLTWAGKSYRPEWSPDGRRISYIHEASDGRRDVWVMSAGGRGKQAVTSTGDVTSAGATWSADGSRLAFAAPDADGVPRLQLVGATAPFGAPVPMEGFLTGSAWCSEDPPPPPGPFSVTEHLAWSPDGTRIAVTQSGDCYYDDAMSWYFPGTEELRQVAASGADCCGYLEWKDLFWGPANQFGYTEQDQGEYGEDDGAPTRIVYPGFASVDGDTGGAPSPSGVYLALTNASSGTPKVIRASADGSARRVLATGYQPDWQPRP